ncbi:hypothetical protein FO519_007887 [Halicephalobus sp. NKZ332]|nr:hypothetical protein FO519_007887 [Halicephalobus sp. NKZ332]
MAWWMSNIQAFYVVCIAVGIFFTLTCITLAAVHLYFVYNYISVELVQTDMYWLVFMCPIIAICGVVGMIVPRSATFLYAVALVYFMLCIYITITLMLTLHGGRKALVNKLMARNKKINMRIPPIGCCLFCIPKLRPTDKVFRRIEWLVFQSPILRILLEILNLIVYMELGNRASLFTLMFHIVDTAQLIYSVQKVVFDFFAGIHWIEDEGGLTASAKSQFWMSFLLTSEMFVVSLISTFIFRPSQTAFFDKFTIRNHNRLSSSQCDDDKSNQEGNQNIQRPVTADSIRSVNQVSIDSINQGNVGSLTPPGHGNESGIESASDSSHSIYTDEGAYREELDRIRDESVNEDGLELDDGHPNEKHYDSEHLDENTFDEVNLDSSRSEKHKVEKF